MATEVKESHDVDYADPEEKKAEVSRLRKRAIDTIRLLFYIYIRH